MLDCVGILGRVQFLDGLWQILLVGDLALILASLEMGTSTPRPSKSWNPGPN
jgi:hypothetical protein